jgi:hypothetical protein
MTNSIFFYSPATLNGKFQVMTTAELTGKGITKTRSNAITTQKNIIYKNLNEFWVTAKKFQELKNNFQTQVACF